MSEQTSSDIDTEKAALRRIVLARRDALDARGRAEKSAAVCDALARELLNGDVPAAGETPGAGNIAGRRPTVAVYAAFGSEADPSAFARAAELAGWRVAYPCMLPREEDTTEPTDESDKRGRFPVPGEPAACPSANGCTSSPAGTQPIRQRMCMRAVNWDDREAAPFLVHPTRAFTARDIDAARYPLVPPRELDAIVVPLVAFDARGMRLGYGGGCYDRYLPTLSATCNVLGIAFTEQQAEAVPAGAHDLPLPRIITA